MKKLLLGLGSLVSVIAPVAAVVSCGDDTPKAQGIVAHTLTTGQIFDMGTDKLQTIIEAYDGKPGHDDISTATIADFISTIDGSELSAENKADLKAFTYHCGEAALTWHTLKFASATLEDQQLNFAIMAWAGAGTTPEEKKAAVKAMIHESDADVNATVESIVKKFSGEDTNFLPMVKMSYTVDKANHRLIAGLARGLADNAMGGIESVKYILSKATTPWTIAEPNQVTVALTADTTQDDLVAKVKAANGFDALITNGATITLAGNSMEIQFALGANDDAIKAAINDAIAYEPAFTGCFETAASA